jgi:hypothetical protein
MSAGIALLADTNFTPPNIRITYEIMLVFCLGEVEIILLCSSLVLVIAADLNMFVTSHSMGHYFPTVCCTTLEACNAIYFAFSFYCKCTPGTPPPSRRVATNIKTNRSIEYWNKYWQTTVYSINDKLKQEIDKIQPYNCKQDIRRCTYTTL